MPIPSQVLQVSYRDKFLNITLDSGATVSYIKFNKALQLGLAISPNNQLALLADKTTRMASIGEVDFVASIKNINLRVRALVMNDLQSECFGGTTFHVDNDIETRIKAGTICIHGKYTITQSNSVGYPEHECQPPPAGLSSPETTRHNSYLPKKTYCNTPLDPPTRQRIEGSPHSVNDSGQVEVKLQAIALPCNSITFPGDFLPIPLSLQTAALGHVSITPSFPKAYGNDQWKPQVCEIINGAAQFKNISSKPLVAAKHSHFRPNQVLIRALHEVDSFQSSPPIYSPKGGHRLESSSIVSTCDDVKHLLQPIIINKTVMNEEQLSRLEDINKRNCRVFNGDLSKGYNHKSGRFFADFTFTNKPPPTRVFVPQYNKKCTDLQQAKCDALEAEGVLIDPKLHDIPVLHVSPSWIQQKGRARHKNLQDCSLDELRFITAFNTLNDSIRPKPTSSCSATSIFLFLARWQFHIFADLNNSYFQLHIKKSLWSYMGIMTPHKGVRVMTRTGQGLLGSDVELEQLLSRVLGEDISQGHCLAIRDDIVIGGNTVNEAMAHYESVLSKLNNNNLKLSASKVRIFPADTEVYGYRIVNGCVLPSEHTVTSLGQTTIDSLTTNKHVNSWKGLYKTLSGHLPALSNIMAPFDAATAGKNSNEKFLWSPHLTAAFNNAMSHLSRINKTYLPKPDEQLILLPDAMSTTPCIGWVLYVIRKDKLFPVVYCTAKLKEYMTKWYPCEKEAIGAVISIDQCAHWISESHLPTLVGPDSLAVVKAADLLRRGSHSTNPRLQSLLASVNRRNVIFYHNSAKAGKHLIPDHLSRMNDSTCRAKDCAIERFLTDIPLKVEAMSVTLAHQEPSLLSLTLGEPASDPTELAAAAVDLADQLISRSGPIPLGNRQVWMNIQKSDESCRTVFRLKMFGELPRKKSTNPIINKIHKESTIHQGLLTVKTFDSKRMREIFRIVVPPIFLDSILTVLHIRLNHPKLSQLKLIFDRYFFSPRLEAALLNLYSSCHTCVSLKKFPRELDVFNPTLVPKHPGELMNTDVIRRSGQFILVTVDLFSFFVTSCLIPSEKSEDLADGIIQTVTPIRRARSVTIRVDKAPGLVKLASSVNTTLDKAGITLQLGDDENKNSNCSVDKAINEFEIELKKISPSADKVNISDLATVSMALNRKILNRGLSAEEIHFSRDSFDNTNLTLNDQDLSDEQLSLKLDRHKRLALSKAPKFKLPDIPSPNTGEIVFIKDGESKHTTRDPHLVINSEGQKSALCKALHSFPTDGRPLNLSSKPKIVDNKFLYRPQNFNESRPTKYDDEAQDIHAEDAVIFINPSDEQQWIPTCQESTEPLIPVIEPLCNQHSPAASPDRLSLDSTSIAVSPEDHLPPAQEEVYNPQIENTPECDLLNNSPQCSDDSPIRIFNPGQNPHIPEKLNQERPPIVGENISFFDSRIDQWVNATVTANLSRKWKNYFNVAYENGEEDGLYLHPDTRWTLRPAPQEVPRHIDQPVSIEPTPQTTPENSGSIHHNSDDHSNIASIHESFSYAQSVPSELDIQDFLDTTTQDSLQWDEEGTQLLSSSEDLWPTDLLAVANFNHLLPLPSDQPDTSDFYSPADSVPNQENEPPTLSSPSPQPYRRYIRPRRRTLPLESNSRQSFLQSFLRRLNPFKKRNQ